MKVHFSLCEDLTSPTTRSWEVGVLELEGETFRSYTSLLPPEGLPDHAFIQEILATLEGALKFEVNEEWPSFRDSAKGSDITDVGEFLAWSRRYSSVYVSLIEEP